MSESYLTLDRISSQKDRATLGVLSVDFEPLFVTLELPWRNNRRSVSCIPEGDYTLLTHYSPKFGPSLWVQEVPKRSEIIFHAGNSVKDTRGCILVGTSFSNKRRISQSRLAIGRLMALVWESEEITLNIRQVG